MAATLGQQELELLQYITNASPASVKDVAHDYGARNGLARTTILTVMERLRKKGFLTRTQAGGCFVYSAALEQPRVLNNLVGNFVENMLGGSLSPFVAYLAERSKLDDAELEELRKLVVRMETERETKP